MLRTFLPALARFFDEELETAPDGDVKGWGQFLTHHHHQIGTYGTSAGVLVKTYAAINAPVPAEAIAYLERELRDAQLGGSKFTQTARLAFLVLATAKAEAARLKALCEEGSKRLLAAQDPAGAWGDWIGKGNAPSRVEATTWAILALSRREGQFERAACVRGAQWLRTQVESSQDIGMRADAVTLGTIFTVLPRRDVDRRTINEAIRVLSVEPTSVTRITFFDFVASEVDPRLRRDFLCVPAFFGYALLACSPGLASLGRGRLRAAWATRTADAHVRAILVAGKPFAPAGASYSSTVDQAFVALSCDLLDSRRTGLDRAYSGVERCVRWAANSFVLPALSAAALTVQTVLAQNPTFAAGYLTRLGGPVAEPLATLVNGQTNAVRLAAVLLALFTGKPLVNSIGRYVGRLVRWPWW